MIFHDRDQAGQLLAKKLLKYKNSNCIVLALPRGGVPIGEQIAMALGVPLEVLIVRKIGAPFHSELAVGAICEDGEPQWNDNVLYHLGLEPDDLGRTVSLEREKIKIQKDLFRRSEKLASVARKIVIVADDGLATGATMTAAVKYLKKKGAAKIIAAVPVAALSSAITLKKRVDELVAIDVREDLDSVGQWYEDFSQVSDEEVIEMLKRTSRSNRETGEIAIPLESKKLIGDLTTFSSMRALIIFAHGSGSSRKSPRNRQVARYLNEKGVGTLLFDLLTDEEAEDRRNVFDIEFLSDRLVAVTKWLRNQPSLKNIPFGFFGASTGAGAALRAASLLEGRDSVYAIVSRGGRPDLAGRSLKFVSAPTLLLVGGEDFGVIELNQKAQEALENCELSIVPGATHLFEEPGALEEVERQAADWFLEHLQPDNQPKKSKAARQLKDQSSVL